MSWQDYVDNQLLASRCVSKAAIAGHDGGVWAKSEGFEVRSSFIFKIFFVQKSFNLLKNKKKNALSMKIYFFSLKMENNFLSVTMTNGREGSPARTFIDKFKGVTISAR